MKHELQGGTNRILSRLNPEPGNFVRIIRGLDTYQTYFKGLLIEVIVQYIAPNPILTIKAPLLGGVLRV